MKTKLLVILPISVIFICSLVSQYAALSYLNSYIQTFQDNLFEQQITFSKIFTQILSQQLNCEIQKYSSYVYLQNNYMSKIIHGRVTFQYPHIYSLLHEVKKYTRDENAEILALYYQRPLLTNVWYHKNITNISLLDEGGQQLISNASRFFVLQRALEYENRYNSERNDRKLRYYDTFVGYSYEGMLTDSPINTTVANLTTPGCGNGLYPYDPRCRFWYQNTLLYDSQIFLKPGILYSTAAPFIASTDCQKLLRYNSISNTSEVYSVMCFSIQLVSIQNYFTNLVKSTKQFYLIEPRSQTIVYNSNSIQDIYNITITTLNQIELQYLESKQDAQLLNVTINSHFTTWINQTINRISLEDSQIIQAQSFELPYNRNGTQTTVILTPVVTYEKVPYYVGYENWVDISKGKYNVQLPYLQINIISDQDLKVQAEKIQSFFHSFFIIVCSILGALAFVSFFVVNFYSNRINRFFNESIDSLTSVLIKLNDEQVRDTIFQNDSENEELFYSYEASELYESFKGIYQILIYTSENFFSDNQTNTLLRLNRNIEFFKQFDNTEAVGITLNNIGQIFLSQNHFFQALDSFSESIIYAKYQIHQFCTQNPLSLSAQLLADYSFDNKFYLFEAPQDSSQVDRVSFFKSQRGTGSNFSKNTNSIQNLEKKNSTKNAAAESNIGIKQTSNTLQQSSNKSNKEMFSAFLKNSFPEKRISKKHSHYLKTKFNQYSKDLQMRSKQMKIGNEEFYEQRVELLSNLYYRKKNYLVALMAYQEHNDNLQNADAAKQRKNGVYSRDLFDQTHNFKSDQPFNNFWKEIRLGLKELLTIVKQLPFWQSQIVEINAKISKCQFCLNKKIKAEQLMKECENQLMQFQKDQILLEQRDKNQDEQFEIFNQETKNLKEEKEFKDLESLNITVSQNQNSSKESQLIQFKSTHKKSQQLFSKKLQKEPNQIQNVSRLSKSQVNQTRSRMSSSKKALHDQSLGSIQNYINKLKNNQAVRNLTESTQQITRQKDEPTPIVELSQSSRIEEMFSYHRRIENIIKDDLMMRGTFSLGAQEAYIRMIKAEQFISQQQYIEAALELTIILETQKQFLSHFPFKVFYQLKIAFNKLGTQCRELNVLMKKFNPSLFFHVEMVVSCSYNKKRIIKVVQFISNLISTILIREHDKLGLTVANQFDQNIITYFSAINNVDIRNDLSMIISNVFNLAYMKQTFASFNQLINFSQILDESQDEEEKEKYLEESYQRCSMKDQNERNTSQLNSPLLSFQDLQFDNFKYQHSCDQSDIQLNNLTSSQSQKYFNNKTKQDNSFHNSLRFNQQKYKLLEERSPEYSLHTHQTKRREPELDQQQSIFLNMLKHKRFIRQPIGDHDGLEDFHIKTEQQQSQQQDSKLSAMFIEEGKDSEMQNSMFHLCLRKILKEFSLKSILQQQQKAKPKQSLNHGKKIDESQQFEMIMESLEKESSAVHQIVQKKFIVLTTDHIHLRQNQLFNQLCLSLYNSETMLIILAFEKGTHFLEICEDQTFIFQGTEIIKVMYSLKKLQNYLLSSRDRFCKLEYPILIQHF